MSDRSTSRRALLKTGAVAAAIVLPIARGAMPRAATCCVWAWWAVGGGERAPP